MQQPRPIPFVNVLAWLFIVLAGIGILTGLLQNLAVYFWPPLVDVLEQTRQPDTLVAPGGGWWQVIMSNLRWVLALNLLLSILLFAAGVGLLQRRNWARLVLAVVLSLVILVTLGNLVFSLQALFAAGAVSAPAGAYEPAMQAASTPSVMAGILFSLLLCVLLGWVVWRLCSSAVAEQFRR